MSEIILPGRALTPREILRVPDEKWSPLLFTPSHSLRTRGEDVTEFAEQFLRVTRGREEVKGKPLRLRQWQRWLMDEVLEENDNGFLRKRRVIIGLPRKNGKSLLGTVLALEKLFYGDASTQIYSAARNREQAKIVFNEAKKQVLDSPILSAIIKPYREELVNRQTGAIYKVLTADADSAQGLAPELVIADEIHAWDSGRAAELYSALTEGSGDRDDFQFIGISTAGATKDSLLGRLYEHAEALNSGDLTDDFFGLYWWGADADADIDSPEVWAKANPNLAEGLLNEGDLISSLSAAESTSLNSFKRYRLNQWCDNSDTTRFMSLDLWNAIRVPDAKIQKGAQIAVGFDGSINDDSTGFVGICMNTGVVELLAGWEKPRDSGDDWTVPLDQVRAAFEFIKENYKVEKMYTDPYAFGSEIQEWMRALPRRVVERLPNSNARIIPMTSQFKLDVIEQQLRHGGGSQLTRHVLNAVESSSKVWKDGKNSPRKIDFLVAAIMANGARHMVLEARKTKRKTGKAIGF